MDADLYSDCSIPETDEGDFSSGSDDDYVPDSQSEHDEDSYNALPGLGRYVSLLANDDECAVDLIEITNDPSSEFVDTPTRKRKVHF